MNVEGRKRGPCLFHVVPAELLLVNLGAVKNNFPQGRTGVIILSRGLIIRDFINPGYTSNSNRVQEDSCTYKYILKH